MSSSNFGYASKRNSFPTRIWAAWRAWWRRLTPQRQDRFSVLAPLIAVILFLAAIVAAFGYLRLEEIEREQEAVQRDVEYAQQQLRLRLLERVNIEPGTLRIASSNAEQEEAKEELEIDYAGDSIEIGFNVTYLIDALSNMSVEMVKLELQDTNSSALLTVPEQAGFKYVVMPMRI